MPARLAIVGRPNVGKSTLFNRLVGRKVAIVADQPGVTRDRREGAARVGGLAATVIDTAGWEEGVDKRSLEARMRAQTERAAAEADAVLFLIDARAGVTPMDEAFARWLRRHAKKTVLLANKCEGRAGLSGFAEAYKLGLGDPVAISGEHGEGMGDLFDRLRAIVGDVDEREAAEAEEEREAEAAAPAARAAAADEEDEAEADAPFDARAAARAAEAELSRAELAAEEAEAARVAARPMQLAIVGRPNVGKSTLLNRILGEDRALTGPEAGITRDAIYVDWNWRGRTIRLVDTAGLRRKSAISAPVERASVGNTLEAIRFADVVALTLDAEQMLEKQDLSIARMVIEEGRALVIAVNKTDLLRAGGEKVRAEAWKKLRDRIEASFSQAKGVALVGLSARTGQGVDKLIPAALKARDVWNKRIPTGDFNRWLGEALERNPPPISRTGRRIKIRYGAQVKARPPTFALFVSRPVDLPESYLRYLENRLREDFDFPGTPIRFTVRKPRNPYAKG